MCQSLRQILIFAVLMLGMAGCQDNSGSGEPERQVTDPRMQSQATGQFNGERWFTATQVERGTQLFADNCSVCHGDKGQGLVDDWRKRLPDGSYPPPPLNGTAHTWHHPLVQLLGTIETGGIPYGGQMPPFASTE